MPGRPLSRRTALGSALAAPLALVACDIDPPQPVSTSSPSMPPPPEDSELVAGVLASLVRAQSVLDAVTQSVPGLVDRLEPVRAAHAAHLEVLVGVADAVPTAPLATVPAQILPALAKVRRSEQRLLRDVRAGCLAAASGDLARVLASVAASTSQHSAALTTEVTP